VRRACGHDEKKWEPIIGWRGSQKKGHRTSRGWCPEISAGGSEAPRKSHSKLVGFEFHERGAKGALAKKSAGHGALPRPSGLHPKQDPGSEVDTRAKGAEEANEAVTDAVRRVGVRQRECRIE
jgi:hypothetical protein